MTPLEFERFTRLRKERGLSMAAMIRVVFARLCDMKGVHYFHQYTDNHPTENNGQLEE